jgi:hypothetical protein
MAQWRIEIVLAKFERLDTDEAENVGEAVVKAMAGGIDESRRNRLIATKSLIGSFADVF